MNSTFVVNLIMMLAWAGLMGSFSWFTLVSGFVLGYAILWLLAPLTGENRNYARQVYHWLKLVVMFHYELIISSVAVLWDIVTPSLRARPAIIDVPLDVKTDAGLLLVTNLISLTPGTLSLEVSEDRKTLTVHAMFGDDPPGLIRDIKQGMEAWVIDAVEPR